MDRVDTRKGLPFIGSAAFGWRFALIGALIALALPAGALFALGRAGADSRRPVFTASASVPSIVATSGPAAVLLMEEEGVRGAHVVQASRTFGYRTDALGDALAIDLAKKADPELSATSIFRSRIDSTNYLYVATRLGVARRITHLMTPTMLAARVAEGTAQGMPGIAKDGKSVRINQDGDLREIVSNLDDKPEDVVLFVNASYFVDGSIALIAEQFEGRNKRVVLVVASLDEDVADLPEGARTQLTDFLTSLQEGLLR